MGLKRWRALFSAILHLDSFSYHPATQGNQKLSVVQIAALKPVVT